MLSIIGPGQGGGGGSQMFCWCISSYIISLVLSGCDGAGRPFRPSVPSKFLIPEEEDEGGRPFRPSVPSKFLIPEEEDEGGGVKTPVVLQFAKSYKLILKN